jgi:molecular chaperone GrpE
MMKAKPHKEDKKVVAVDKAQEYLEGWKRERASFENYKKEESERLGHVRALMQRDLLARLLPVIDNFELALKSTPQDAQKSEWFVGYTYIKKQFDQFLRDEGIEEIQTEGKEFDPYLHEAVESEGNGQGKHLVQEELQKGYKINDYVLRPARVKVKKVT